MGHSRAEGPRASSTGEHRWDVDGWGAQSSRPENADGMQVGHRLR